MFSAAVVNGVHEGAGREPCAVVVVEFTKEGRAHQGGCFEEAGVFFGLDLFGGFRLWFTCAICGAVSVGGRTRRSFFAPVLVEIVDEAA